jgi:Lipoprotein LpqB beta-propeller domain
MPDPRLDRRQLLRALLLAAGGLAAPAACGVPSGGRPIVDAPGPSYDPGTGVPGRPPQPGDASSATELVELFLYAISGPLNTAAAMDDARRRARQFLTREAADLWKPTDQVTVVRIDALASSISGPDRIVSSTLKPVGTLSRDRGWVDPSGAGDPWQVAFTVSQMPDGSGLRISDFPDDLQNRLLLGTNALDNRYFTPQVIYFWESSMRHSYLVPDLRYVPNTGLTDSGRLTTIVRWLLFPSGASDLISSVAGSIFPPGTDLSVTSLSMQGDRLVVPFSAELQGLKGDLSKVLVQLQWSLQPLHKLDAPVELQIAGQPQRLNQAADYFWKVNPADEGTNRSDNPQPFCVAGGAVTPLDGTLPPVLASPEHNRDVSLAALSRDRHGAALVTTGHQLMLGREDAGKVIYTPIDMSGRTWSRPVWLPSGGRLLVAVDGRLHTLSTAGVVAQNPLQTGVSAFAVAPDGYRIALIKDGRLAVAALRDDSGQVTMSSAPHWLDPGLSDLSGVAWSRLDRIVVAGRAENQWHLAEVSIDGALRTVWGAGFYNAIVSVVGYPRLPSDPPGPGQIMVHTTDNSVSRVFVGASSVTSQALSVKPTPGPSPSTAANTARTALSAPFYPD